MVYDRFYYGFVRFLGKTTIFLVNGTAKLKADTKMKKMGNGYEIVYAICRFFKTHNV